MQIAHFSFKPLHLVIWFVASLALVSCGAGNTTSDTNPTAQSVTPIPTYQFVPPTDPPQFSTMAASTANAPTASGDAVDAERVTRGRDRYVALECGACHGENAEGSDQASALAGTSLSEADFISFMRSGGTVGSSHQYASNRLSQSGGENLYLYLLSLDEQES